MSRPTLRQAIARFLDNRKADSPFLLERYTTSLETQVMTTKEGKPTDNPGEYTDGQQTWKDKRWPYQAGSDPTYNDPPLEFSPADKVDRIGTTWWDFENHRSVAVGIDIDYEEGHASTTNTNDDVTLAEIVEKLSDLDYVTVVRSTGGKGLHVYVFFDNPPESQNHHEHTIVARKTLELIGQDIGYDLKQHVDCVGSVFWIWSKSSPADHPGFSVVKAGNTLDATRLASITLPQPAYRGGSITDFEVTELEEEHKRVMEALAQYGYMGQRADMNLIHTHTGAIAKCVEEGFIEGPFSTDSDVSDLNTPNCFLAPQRGGSFRCVRFGQTEHETGKGWHFSNGKNFCFINEKLSDVEIMSKHTIRKRNGKIETETVEDLLADFGIASEDVSLPSGNVWADLTACGDLRVESSEAVDGWEAKVDGKKTKYVKVFKKQKKGASLKDRVLQMADDHVRYVIQDGTEKGWYHRTSDGDWISHRGFSDVACVVDDLFPDFSQKARHILHTNPWTMVKIPFRSEYPGNRLWNYNAPQLKVEPAKSGGDHPYFDLILEHIGLELNEPVAQNNWCRKANIQSGADYLRAWLACLIHHADQPLPYLFLTGPQNSGKSIFHESCRFLFTHGITSASNSLTSQFNGELEGCFLVYIEERDLADKRYNAYEKIKEWVTGRDLTVRPLYQQQYTAPNYLHFVQMANSSEHLPLEDGDTRIVAIEVPALKKPVPKAILEGHLKKEAPRFLRTLINTQLPPPVDRLRIPALRTVTKSAMEQKAMSPVMVVAKQKLYPRDGHKVEIGDFYKAYVSYVDNQNIEPEPEFLVVRELSLRSDRYQLGVKDRKQYIVNVSLDPKSRPKKDRIETDDSGRF